MKVSLLHFPFLHTCMPLEEDEKTLVKGPFPAKKRQGSESGTFALSLSTPQGKALVKGPACPLPKRQGSKIKSEYLLLSLSTPQ